MVKAKKRNGICRRLLIVFGAVVGFTAMMLLIMKYNLSVSITNTPVFLPEMKINLNGVSLDEITHGDKDSRYSGNEMVLEQGEKTRLFNEVTIKGRGNYSWKARKKSYNIILKNKEKLLSKIKDKKYALIANILDDSSLRNDVAHYITRIINSKHPINGDFVTLDIDNNEQGLYYLTNTLKVGKNSVDLREPMGILVEIDNAYCEEAEDHYISNTFSDCIVISDTVEDELSKTSIDDFMVKYNAFEEQVKKGNFVGAEKYADMTSWAMYYLVSEFTGDVDAYVTSWYLYKDGLNDRIHAGLGWDFDAAFGNKNWSDFEDTFFSPTTIMSRLQHFFRKKENYVKGNGMGCMYEEDGLYEDSKIISQTMCYMLDMPEFDELVSKIYKEKLVNKRRDIINYIKDKANYIREEAINDNEMWEKGDFDTAVDYLIWWVDKRFDLFDELYGGEKIEYLEEPFEV